VGSRNRTKMIACFSGQLSCGFSTRLKPGLLIFLVALACGLAACHRTHALHNAAANQKPKLIACTISPEYASELSRDASTDVYAERAYAATIAQMLQLEKFDDLDCLATTALENEEKFSGGEWKLHAVYKGLSEPVQYPTHSTDEDWEILLQRLQSWIVARPQSVTAHVALAEAYIAYAADARGDGDANTVSEGGWKLIAQRTDEAKRVLREASTLLAKSPEWYVVMLQVAHNEGWNEGQIRALFDEATRSQPGYFYYARILAINLLPKGGGKPGDTEKFMQEAADRVGGEKGDILYFQIATSPHLICACDGDPHVSLPRMERGLEASEKQYGTSLVTLNRVAFIAARTRPDDEILANDAFTRISDDQWDEETWKWEEDFHMAKNFAASRAPELRLEAAADANMETPEGLRYRSSFEKPYKDLLRKCVEAGDGDVGTFKTFTNIGSNGTVEDVRIAWNSPAAMCLYEKLRALQQEKATLFPRPPHDSYWVRLDLDWAEFSPVAAK
jgi:hypothetical protein